ncbi:hypothetical protein SLA2020_462440 [Shorea laevis]
MDSSRDSQERRGNQGEEKEEVGISVTPLATIMPPELADLPEEISSESGVRSSTHDDAGEPSASSSSESTPSEMRDDRSPSASEGGDVVAVERWEDETINGRLSNIRKAS